MTTHKTDKTAGTDEMMVRLDHQEFFCVCAESGQYIAGPTELKWQDQANFLIGGRVERQEKGFEEAPKFKQFPYLVWGREEGQKDQDWFPLKWSTEKQSQKKATEN